MARAKRRAKSKPKKKQSTKPKTTKSTKTETIVPSPKKIKRSPPRKKSPNFKLPAVTPSPPKRNSRNATGSTVLTRRACSKWLKYDTLLHGANYKPNSIHCIYGDASIDSNDYNWETRYDSWEDSFDPREENFHSEMEKLLQDPLFGKPFGVESDTSTWSLINHQSKQRWRHYAVTLSKYPKQRIEAIREEYKKDMEMHASILKELTSEINERRQGGKRFYLRALNCIFFDSFARCHVPQPPLPHWDLKVKLDITRKELYKKQLRAWNGYKSRVFSVVMLVLDNPITREILELPDIEPLEFRGDMVSMSSSCTNEETIIDYNYNYRENETSSSEEEAAVVDDDKKDDEDLNEPQCKCYQCKKDY